MKEQVEGLAGGLEMKIEPVIPSEACFARESSCAVEGPAVMKEGHYFVYMVASKSRVLYIGMTNNVERRVWEHRNEGLENGIHRKSRSLHSPVDLLRNQLTRLTEF